MAHEKPSPTIQDVANAAGVSVATVSRVLNNRYGVSPATSIKVQRVIDELGYESSLVATSLRNRTTNVIGFITIDLDTSFNTEVLKGIVQATKEFGYDFVAYSMGKAHLSGGRPAWEMKQVRKLNGGLTDGIIISTPTIIDLPSNFPIVAVDPNSETGDYPAVIGTNREGALAIMEHLIGLAHRRIGFIGGRPDLLSASRRQQGYEDGLRQANISVVPELVETGDFTYKTGYDCAMKLLNLPNPPTAIFAANDESAFGVMEAAHEIGLSIPDDLSLVGFDNIPEAASSTPTLTTVDQSMKQMGSIATEMLVKLIQGEFLDSNLHKIPTRLVVRDSCGAIANNTSSS